MTAPEKGCLLLPVEVVLHGCGNSGSEGGKEGGSPLSSPFPNETTYPKYTNNP